ncbi:MAG: di-heme oxidoredictase family protein [Pseudomonadota bacterium]
MNVLLITILTTLAGLPDGVVLEDHHLGVVPRTAEEAARIGAVVAPAREFDALEQFETNPAGKATLWSKPGRTSFSQPSASMEFDRKLDFELGKAMFEKLWVGSPSSNLASDGLGPIFNARSCRACHMADGRGSLALSENSNISLLLRLSVPAQLASVSDEIEGFLSTLPEPTYGTQFQDRSVPGMEPEGRFEVSYAEEPVRLSDGEVVYLRRPTYSFTELNYGPMDEDTMVSPRIAQQMIGLGLLDAIPAADILAHADPEDLDGDGISGRPQIVPSKEFGVPMLGRFGHKATEPSLYEQTAAAFHGDIGISTWMLPEGYGECTARQTDCRDAPDGNTEVHGNVEIPQNALDLTVFFAGNLAVPTRRGADDPEVLRGKEIFYTAGCTGCHVPKFVTARLEDRPEHSIQLIWPYSDMLLHDMGPDLADNRPVGMANGQEWRTPPLWGIGLTETVSGHTHFLHDGRARSLLEAILWHGGEAAPHKQRVVEMPKSDRDALIRFLESL